MPEQKVPRTCKNCQRPLIARQKTACSPACRDDLRRTQIARVCETCGSTFTADPNQIKKRGAKFCSHACYSLSLVRPRDELFLRHVDKQDGCWVWTSATNNKGYGVFKVTAEKFKQLAHRFSYELHHRIVLTRSQKVLHTCDNPPCVRPDHLFLGTQKDNMRDCVAKGRWRTGVMINGPKLNPERVRAIRNGFAEGLTYKELALIHSVHSTMIGYIVTRKCWKHVV